ncbi:hypothetical protein [uncultured Winogradskyella sp.]|uniref:hypothetical protein n=1 Tax=uncultured Winogradskyella sp. TaxID=395353 RepID=UPI0030D87E21|tara:strand:+ start:9689 stop:10903 length:1215 start_codon:yes stop_codon:yes gene_type:complete
MKSKISKYLKFKNSYYGLELSQNGKDTTYHGLELKKKKKELHLNRTFITASLETLSKEIPKGTPVALVINSESVLTKKVETQSVEPLKIVHLAFPNIKIEAFYYEISRQGKYCFVSICRESYISGVLERFNNSNISITNISLGNLATSFIANYIDSTEVFTTNSVITLNAKDIFDISGAIMVANNTYNINGLDIKNTQILSFSAALNTALDGEALLSNFEQAKSSLNTSFNEKLFFSLFIKIGFGFLFVVLMINMFFFSNYQNKVGTLNETAMVLEISKTNVINLKQKVQKSQKIVEDVLKSNASKSSFYLDALLYDLPKSILLTNYNYQPLIKKLKEDKPVLIDKNVILISGSITQSIEFPQWLSKLESIEWVNRVEIQNFEDISKYLSEFSIKLIINHESKN